jgi:uncharacterized protein (TIGR00369 family)
MTRSSNLAGVGSFDRADQLRLSGLELIRGMAEGRLPLAPISALFDMRPIEVSDGEVAFASRPEPRHYNTIGKVHGGFAAMLLDSAMGCAVHTRLAAGIGYATVDLQTTYLVPISAATGEVVARGSVISCSKRLATARGELRDSLGLLLAHGTTTCLVFPLGRDSAKTLKGEQ